jgi:hypothetical protein
MQESWGLEYIQQNQEGLFNNVEGDEGDKGLLVES